MTVLDHEKRKKKSISDSENLLKALKDEKISTLLEHYQERYPILIEPMEEIKTDIKKKQKIILLFASSIEEKISRFI
jgi:hypothetical protein